MGVQLTTERLRTTLAGEFRAAVEAVTDAALVAEPAAPATGQGWGTEITAGGVLDGRLTVWVDLAGVQAIARAMMGLDEAPEPSVATGMLKELFTQAAAATSLKDGWEGLTLTVGAPRAGSIPDGAVGIALKNGAAVMAVLTMAGTLQPGASRASQDGPAAGAMSEYPGNLAALLDIDLPLVVRFARTEMSLRALSQLVPGSMVDMGRSPDAPVHVLVGSQVIAEGEVVVVNGNYGVRITSLVSPADRLRAMEL